MPIRFSVIFTILLFQINTSASLDLCPDASRAFNGRGQSLMKEYRDHFSERIENRKNKPRIEKPFANSLNQNEIVYLLHGFIGTPYEMTSIAQNLRRNGYTTFLDLLPGHGISGTSANAYTQQQLIDHTFSNISDLLDCGRPIHLVGFSTGGTLIHRYMQSKLMTSSRLKNLTSVNLISPFYAPTIFFSSVLSMSLKEVIPAPSIPGLYLISKHPDLLPAVLETDHYMQSLPLFLADEIMNLGRETLKGAMPRAVKNRVPVQAFFSEADLTASMPVTQKKLDQDFAILTPQVFPLYLKSPHHLMSPQVHSLSEYVEDEILKFIVNSTL